MEVGGDPDGQLGREEKQRCLGNSDMGTFTLKLTEIQRTERAEKATTGAVGKQVQQSVTPLVKTTI